ncbi:MAG: prepilin peptidase [Phycisphaerales bacterium]|nr:prepilin peptidase [Phycisphaerales bacterium]
MLLANVLSTTLLTHLPWAVFVFCLGACVGSFINVVVHRLPRGMSLAMPPSRCETCGARLRFFRENLPIIGWLVLRGRCRYCRQSFSPAYMFVELGMALLFLLLYVVLFWFSTRTPWIGGIGGEWWGMQPFATAWPAFILISFLLAGLWAMTIIDARTFTIPIQIPMFITVLAFVLWPVQGAIASSWPRAVSWPIPGVNWWWFLVAAGGMLGVVTSRLLLAMGVLRWSFADYEDYLQGDESLADYPHGRREMGVEFLYLLPIIIGLVVGGIIGTMLPGGGLDGPSRVLQALGGSFIGYLSGAGIVWAVRMFGTLGFGREAMGLGDVHLMGAVGAVLGWFDPLVIFFIAPFLGLGWVLACGLVSRITRSQGRELPYGPHLAAATVLLFFCRPALVDAWQVLVPTIPMPQRALVPPEDSKSTPTSTMAPSGLQFPDLIFESTRALSADSLNGGDFGMVASSASPDPSVTRNFPVSMWQPGWLLDTGYMSHSERMLNHAHEAPVVSRTPCSDRHPGGV